MGEFQNDVEKYRMNFPWRDILEFVLPVLGIAIVFIVLKPDGYNNDDDDLDL